MLPPPHLWVEDEEIYRKVKLKSSSVILVLSLRRRNDGLAPGEKLFEQVYRWEAQQELLIPLGQRYTARKLQSLGAISHHHLGFARSMLLIRTVYVFLTRPRMRTADLPPEDLESEQDHGFCTALTSWSLVQTLSPTLSVQDDFDDLPQDGNSQKKKRPS